MNNKPYILSEEEKNDIMQTLEQSAEQNKNLKVLSELPSNNGQEEHTPEQGELVEAMVKIDSKTGEHVVVGPVISDTSKNESDIMENLSDLAENDFVTDFDVNSEDIRKLSEEETSIIGKFDISEETCVELIQLINQRRYDKKKITYNILPEQVKGFVDDYLRQSGIINHSVENNTIRNNISELLIDDFISNIGMNKCIDDFNTGIEKIYEEAGKEISPLVKDYNKSKTEYLRKLSETADEDKKIIIEKTLDAINDAYELTRLKESASKIKIKKFDLEKPKRVFDSFLSKYKDSKYNIYDLYTVLTTLNRHLVWNEIIEKDDITSALSFLIALCKYCTNYRPEISEQHAFMFYITYNIILLDIYKDDQYNDFAKPFLNNIKEVIDNLK